MYKSVRRAEQITAIIVRINYEKHNHLHIIFADASIVCSFLISTLRRQWCVFSWLGGNRMWRRFRCELVRQASEPPILEPSMSECDEKWFFSSFPDLAWLLTARSQWFFPAYLFYPFFIVSCAFITNDEVRVCVSLHCCCGKDSRMGMGRNQGKIFDLTETNLFW